MVFFMVILRMVALMVTMVDGGPLMGATCLDFFPEVHHPQQGSWCMGGWSCLVKFIADGGEMDGQ